MVETKATAIGDLHAVGDRAEVADPAWVSPVLTVIQVVDTQADVSGADDGILIGS